MTDEFKCPDRECHDTVISLATCIKSKIGYRQMLVGLGSLLGVITVIALFGIESAADQRNRITEVEKNQAVCAEQVASIKKEIENVNKNIKKMQGTQVTKEDMKVLIKEVKRVIRDKKVNDDE